MAFFITSIWQLSCLFCACAQSDICVGEKLSQHAHLYKYKTTSSNFNLSFSAFGILFCLLGQFFFPFSLVNIFKLSLLHSNLYLSFLKFPSKVSTEQRKQDSLYLIISPYKHLYDHPFFLPAHYNERNILLLSRLLYPRLVICISSGPAFSSNLIT